MCCLIEFPSDSTEWEVVEGSQLPLQQVEAQKDVEGQPSASSTATGTASSLAGGTASSAAAGTASSEFSPEFYDVVLMDYIHETMAGDSKKLSRVAADMLKSINHEDNALSLN